MIDSVRPNRMQRTKRGQDGGFAADSGVGRTRKVTLERSRHDPYLIFPLTAALLLGLIGFMPRLGFIGPLGQGSTGHVGLFLGWAVGVAAALRKLRTKGFVLALLVSATLWTGTLLMWGQHYRP